MTAEIRQDTLTPSTRSLWWLVLAVSCLYLWGLDNVYMPSNGDEMVYAHIARLTAASGHWLPLVSELEDMRNTKPPLLFWQSLWVTDWGAHWQLWRLRLPSLMYLCLTCSGMAWVLYQWQREWRTAAWAVLCLLLSWGTFRYGRPYLTTAPEMFWYSLAPAWVLVCAARSGGDEPVTRWQDWFAWTCLGLLTGVGLTYKSFALVAPVALGVWVMRLGLMSQRSWAAVGWTTLQTAWMATLALGVFALWFWLDPQPQAVWREFVQRENASKMGSDSAYFSVLLSWRGSGDYLLWPVQNPGLLFPWVLALAGVGWRHMRTHGVSKPWGLRTGLVVWIVAWCVVFWLPSQRSSRYVLPLLPALAMLMALHVNDLKPWVSRVGGAIALVWLAVMGWLAWHAHGVGVMTAAWLVGVALTVMGGVVCVWRLWRGGIHPPLGFLCAVALCLLSLNMVLHSLASDPYAFQGQPEKRPHAQTVWVNEGFNGAFERLQFLLPGNNRFVPDQSKVVALSDGLDATPGTWFVVARSPLASPLPCEKQGVCERVAVRWDIEQRLQPGQVHAGNVWRPSEWLWRQEWLMRVP